MNCIVVDCPNPVRRNGMCEKHSARVARHGHPGLAEGPQARTLNFIEDVEWMLRSGETHAEAVASRLGVHPRVVERRLQRQGRNDLIRRLTGFGTNIARGSA